MTVEIEAKNCSRFHFLRKTLNNNMNGTFTFENRQHVYVFESSLIMNEIWTRWKQQFKEVKSFIGHEIKNDDHEMTASKSAEWLNKYISGKLALVGIIPNQLFSFSSDKDRRTDSRIRRKNTAQSRRESNPEIHTQFPLWLRSSVVRACD